MVAILALILYFGTVVFCRSFVSTYVTTHWLKALVGWALKFGRQRGVSRSGLAKGKRVEGEVTRGGPGGLKDSLIPLNWLLLGRKCPVRLWTFHRKISELLGQFQSYREKCFLNLNYFQSSFILLNSQFHHYDRELLFLQLLFLQWAQNQSSGIDCSKIVT